MSRPDGGPPPPQATLHRGWLLGAEQHARNKVPLCRQARLTRPTPHAAAVADNNDDYDIRCAWSSQGANVNMVQDLPITKPYSGQDMTSLVTATQHPTLCPFYVDIAPAGPRVQAFIDRLKSIGDSIHFSTCKNGDLQLQALTTSARVGTQLQDLLVLPPQEPAAECDRSLPPDQQLEAATAAGDAATAVLPQKQLARVLHAAPLTSPLQVLMGVAGHGGYVHVMFVYAADGGGGGGSGGGYDAASSFSFKLPTKEEG